MPAAVDLTIVGGGYTGLSASLLAAEAGLSAHVIEVHEIGNDALERLPMLLLAPGLLISIWNNMFADEALDPPDLFESYFDLLFGKPGA